jgi:hypothetical protein
MTEKKRNACGDETLLSLYLCFMLSPVFTHTGLKIAALNTISRGNALFVLMHLIYQHSLICKAFIDL